MHRIGMNLICLHLICLHLICLHLICMHLICMHLICIHRIGIIDTSRLRWHPSTRVLSAKQGTHKRNGEDTCKSEGGRQAQ